MFVLLCGLCFKRQPFKFLFSFIVDPFSEERQNLVITAPESVHNLSKRTEKVLISLRIAQANQDLRRPRIHRPHLHAF